MATDTVTLLVNQITPTYDSATKTLFLDCDNTEPPKTPETDHSITFADISMLPRWDADNRRFVQGVNTWDEWHLIPTSRPEIPTPEAYSNYIDLPGGHGKIDMSEYLTGGPVYKNRSGTLDFYVANGYGDWVTRYNRISAFLHGKVMYMALLDEPDYYYKGRFKVNQYRSDGKTNWSSVQISYELEPFKKPISGNGGGII